MIDPTTGLRIKQRPTNIPPAPKNPGVSSAPTKAYTLPDDLERYNFAFTPGMNMNETRAQNQSGLLAKGLGRMVVNAGFEMAKVVPYIGGGLMTLGAAVTGQDNPISYMVDNQLLNWINEGQEYFNEEMMPIYQTMAAMQGSWWERMTEGSFWATQGADAGAFFLSMILPGRLAATAGVGSALVRGVGQGAKLLKPGFQTSAKAMKYADGFAAVLTNTMAESAAEASFFYQDIKDQLVADGMSEEEAAKVAGANAAGVFGANVGTLFLSNLVLDQMLFKSFDGLMGLGTKKLGKRLDEIEDMSVNPLRTNLFKAGAYKAGVGIASEGFYEEGTQYAIEKYFDARAKGLTDDGVLSGISNEYFSRIFNDTDMMMGITLGGLLGGLGGTASGVNSELAERRRWEGQAAEDPNSFRAKVKRKLGMTPRQATVGLRELLNENYVNYQKSVSDIYKRNEAGKLIDDNGDVITSAAQLPAIDEDKFNEFTNKQKGLILQMAGIRQALVEGNKEAYEIQKAFLDLNFMIPYFDTPGGMEVLTKHLTQKAEQEATEAMEQNPDLQLNPKDMAEGLLADAKAYKEIYDRLQDTHRVNLRIKDPQGRAEQFTRLVYENKLSNAIKEYSYDKAIKSTKQTLSSLNENTAEGKGTMKQLEKKLEALEKARENVTNVGARFYDNKEMNRLYNRFENNADIMEESDKVEGAVLEDIDGRLYELKAKHHNDFYEHATYDLVDMQTGDVKTVPDLDEYLYKGNINDSEDNRTEKAVTEDEANELLTNYKAVLAKGDANEAAKFYNENIANNDFRLPKDLTEEFFNLVEQELDNMDEFEDMIDFIDKLKANSESRFFKKKLDKLKTNTINRLKNQRDQQIKAIEDLIQTEQTKKDDLLKDLETLSKQQNDTFNELQLLEAQGRLAVRDLYNSTELDKRTKEFKAEVKEIEDRFKEKAKGVRAKLEDIKASRDAIKKTIDNIEKKILDDEKFKNWIKAQDTYVKLSEYIKRQEATHHRLMGEQENFRKDFEIDVKNMNKAFFEKLVKQRLEVVNQYDQAISDTTDNINEMEKEFNRLLNEFYSALDTDTKDLEKALDKLTQELDLAKTKIKELKAAKDSINRGVEKLRKMMFNSDELDRIESFIETANEIVGAVKKNRQARRKNPRRENGDTLITNDPAEGESLKRGYANLFRGLGGSHFPGGELTKVDSQQRYYYFMQTNRPSDFNVRIVRDEDYPALFDPMRESFEQNADEDVKQHDVLMAVVTNKQGEYVDMNGNVIPDIDPAKAVYTTLRVPKKLSEDGKNYDKSLYKPQGMSDSQHQTNIKKQIDWFTRVREDMITSLNNGEIILVPLVGKSRGLRVLDRNPDGSYNNKSVEALGIDIFDENVDITIPTSNKTQFAHGQVIQGLKGHLFIKDANDNFHRGFIRKLTGEEIETAYQLLKGVAENTLDTKVVGDMTYEDALKQITFFGYRKDGDSPMFVNEKGAGTKEVVIDGQSYSLILDSEGELANAPAIREGLSNRYHNASSALINDDKNTEGSYKVVRYLNGAFTQDVYDSNTDIRSNYLEYLFQSDNPVVTIPTPLMDGKTETVQFKNQYAIADFSRFQDQPGFTITEKEKPVESKLIQTGIQVLSKNMPDKVFPTKDLSTIFFEESRLGSVNEAMIGYDNAGSLFLYTKDGKSVIPHEFDAPTNQFIRILDEEGDPTTLTAEEARDEYNRLSNAGQVTFVESQDKPQDTEANKALERLQKKAGQKKSTPKESTPKTTNTSEAASALERLQKKAGNKKSGPTREKTPSQQQAVSEQSKANDALAKLQKKAADKSKPKRRPGRKGPMNRQPDPKVTRLEDMPAMVKWFRSKFPNVPLNVTKDLIEGGNWGQFVDNAVKVYELAGEGTVYHEAFHVVFNLYMTPTERMELLDAYRDHHKLSENNYQIEERLADEFMDYMLTGKMTNVTIPKQRSFFRRLWDMLKSLFTGDTNPRDLSDVFNEIILKTYNTKAKYDYQGPAKFRAIESLTEAETNDVVNGMVFMLFDELRYDLDATGDSVMSVLLRGEKGVMSESFRHLLSPNNSDNLLNRVIDSAYDGFFNNDDEVTANQIAILENIRDNYADQLFDMLTDRMNRIGIQIEVGNLEEVEDVESNEEESGYSRDVAYDQVSVEISGKMTASSTLKKFLATFTDYDRSKNHTKNDLGFYVNVNFSKMYSLLANKLSNLDNLSDILQTLEENNPYLNFANDQINNTIDINPEASAEDMITAMQIFQAFAKQKVNYKLTVMNVVDGKVTYETIDPSNNYAQSKLRNTWAANAYSNDIYLERDGGRVYNLEKLKAVIDPMDAMATDKDYMNFLNRIGIELTEYNDQALPTNIKRRVMYIKDGIKNGSLEDLFAKEETNQGGNLKALIDLEMESSQDFYENQHLNLDGKTVYDVVLNTYLSILINKINRAETEQELFDELDYLKDSYLKNSLVKKMLFKKTAGKLNNRGIDLSIHEGARSDSRNIMKQFKNMNKADKIHMLVNDTLRGNFHMLRAADNGLERTFNFGGLFFETPLEQGAISDNVITAMLGYLADEIESSHLENYQFYNRTVAEPLAVFDFLTGTAREQAMRAFDELNNDSTADVLSMLDTTEIKVAIEDFLNNEIEKAKSLLTDNMLIQPTRNGYKNIGIADVKPALDENDFRELAAKLAVNFVVANIEQTKWFTGHPKFYKSVADFFKRMSALVGTKKLADTSPIINDWISKNLKRFDEKVPDNKFRVYVVNDISFQSVIPELASSYTGDESDAGGLISLDEYREFLFRVGDWTPEMEEVYLYENDIKQVPYDSPFESIRGKQIDPEVFGTGGFVLPPLKPQYFGPQAVTGEFVPGMLKFALMPLLPSMAKGRNLSKIADHMNANKIGIVTFSSANKIGRKLPDGEEMSLYGENNDIAEFNKEAIQEYYYSYFGIQVDNAAKRKAKSSEGTQQKKQHKTDLYELGTHRTDFIANKYTYDGEKFKVTRHDSKTAARDLEGEYNQLNSAKIELGKLLLRRRVGLTDQDGIDYDRVIESLVKEARDRDLPDNVIDSIYGLSEGLGVEGSPQSEKLENVLFSIAESETISRKRFGAGLVQVPVTGFESDPRSLVNRNIQASDELSFYTNKDGQVTSMEVLLPNIFKQKYFKDLDVNSVDPRLLEFIAFRIPTQGLSSIEHVRIKGFLPAHAGDIIVMPSEIVVKNGSDFDFDKMFTLFANYKFSGSKPEYIEYETEDMDKLFKRRKSEIIKEYALDKGSLAQLMAERDDLIRQAKAREADITTFKGIGKNLDMAARSNMQVYFTNLLQIRVIKEAMDLLDQAHKEGYLDFDELVAKGEEFDEQGFTQDAINEFEAMNEAILSNLQLTDKQKSLLNDQPEKILDDLIKRKEILNAQIREINAELESAARTIFDGLSLPMKNGLKAVENRMNEVQKEIILAPSNYERLTTPLVDSIVKSEAYRIAWINSGSDLSYEEWYDTRESKESYSRIVDLSYISELQEQFLNAKAGIGISALQQTNHILAQKHNLFVQPSFTDRQGSTIDTSIRLTSHQQADGTIPLGHTKNKEDVLISELLNQMTSAYVDAAKDPFVFLLNAGTETANTFLYLIRAGVPLRQLVLFMNQPIIKEFLKIRGITESIYWDRAVADNSNLRMSRSDLIAKAKESIGGITTSSNPSVTESDLEQAIRDFNNGALTESQKADQFAYLDDFLRYTETAKALSDAIAATTYDTRGFGKNSNMIFVQLKNTAQVAETGAIGNFTSMMTDPNSYISPYHLAAYDMIDIYSDYVLTMSSPDIQDDMSYIIDTMSKAGKSFNQISEVLDKYKTEFLTNLLHQNPDLAGKTELLFTGPNSLPNRVLKVKKLLERSDKSNALLDHLDVIIRGDMHYLRPRASGRMDVFGFNEVVEGWRALSQDFPDIYEDLADFVILQSGMTRSLMNFIEFMPHELFASKMTPQLARIDVSNFLEKFKSDASMALNNNITPDSRFNKGHAKVDPMSKVVQYTKNESGTRIISRNVVVTNNRRGVPTRGINQPNEQLKDYHSIVPFNIQRGDYSRNMSLYSNSNSRTSAIPANTGTEAMEVSGAFILNQSTFSLAMWLNQNNVDVNQLTVTGNMTESARSVVDQMLVEIKEACE